MRLIPTIFCLAMPALAAAEEVLVRIDLSDQEMTVFVDDRVEGVWPVSTARAGKFTPIGLYHVQSMKRMHYSSLYQNAPMPHSLFFSGNFAIHGTHHTDRLGTPASAGCVRLHPDNARTLFEWVVEHGPQNTLIEIQL